MMKQWAWSNTFRIIGRLLILVGVAPLFLLVSASVVSPPDPEGIAFAILPVFAWAIIVTGSGAILLRVIGLPGRGDAVSQRIWNRLDTAVAYLLIVAGILPMPFLFYRDISRQYGSIDRTSTIPVALLDGEYTSHAFRIEGDRLYNIAVTLNPPPGQGAESSAQGVQSHSQEAPNSVRLEYETVRLGGGEPAVWDVYDPVEIGQKVWIKLPWYDRFISHVKVNLRFSQGGKSYSGGHPHVEITPCAEVGGQWGAELLWAVLCGISSLFILRSLRGRRAQQQLSPDATRPNAT